MNDLDLLKKKTGMTIGTAWVLMFSSVALLFLSGFIYGIMLSQSKKTISMTESTDMIMIFMVLSFLVFATIGFYVNKKELPYFSNVSSKVMMILFVVAICWSVISSIFLDYFMMSEEMNKMTGFSKSWWFATILNASMIIFQIGVLGHGLIRNYTLKKSMIAISFICIVFYMPAAVSSMVIQSMILLYIYYRTASFWVVLLTSTLMYVPEYIFREIYAMPKLNYNYYKNVIMPSTSVYYTVWAFAVLGLITALWYLKQNTQVIKWERDDEPLF